MLLDYKICLIYVVKYLNFSNIKTLFFQFLFCNNYKILKSYQKFDKFIFFVYNFFVIFYFAINIMLQLEKKLQEFNELTNTQKKEKLMNIFEYAKNKIDFSETAISYLTSNEEPNELVMWNLYELILQAIMFSSERNQADFEKKIEETTWSLNERANEAQELDSQEADNLLKLIDFI